MADEAAIPINPNRMCPALIFAARRNDRVIKRTEILSVSVITRKGFNHSGAPLGSRWATNDLGAWNNPLKIKLNHSGSPSTRVNIRCLVVLKTYGKRPKRLRMINNKNKGVKIDGNPFRLTLNVREICELITSVGKVGSQEYRFIATHRVGWRRVIENRERAQNANGDNDEYMEQVEGSKEEKMSVIIKIWGIPFRVLKTLSLNVNLKS